MALHYIVDFLVFLHRPYPNRVTIGNFRFFKVCLSTVCTRPARGANNKSTYSDKLHIHLTTFNYPSLATISPLPKKIPAVFLFDEQFSDCGMFRFERTENKQCRLLWQIRFPCNCRTLNTKPGIRPNRKAQPLTYHFVSGLA